MTTMKPQKVLALRQGSGKSIKVTIPNTIIKELDIKPGDTLTIEAARNIIKIKPITQTEEAQ